MIKEFICNAGDTGSIPGWERYPGAGNGNPLQYFCLANPMDRGTWWATVHGFTRVAHDLATKHRHTHTHTGLTSYNGNRLGKKNNPTRGYVIQVVLSYVKK